MDDRPAGPLAYLRSDRKSAGWVRSLLSVGGTLIGAYIVLLLITGQAIGAAPAVVVESGSMMQCEEGIGFIGDACGATSFGRIGTIDPGDIVLVRDANDVDDLKGFDEGGKERYGLPGDVVIYERPGNTPVIHRAMVFVEITANGTYNLPHLGVFDTRSLDVPELRDAQRWGIAQGCVAGIDPSLGPEDSGWLTKGDNNPCWDQSRGHSAGIIDVPVTPDMLLGVARGEIPWVGMLKLFVSDQNNYQQAPSDLARNMWFTLALIIGGPYVYDKIRDRFRGGRNGDQEPQAGSGGSTTDPTESTQVASDPEPTSDSSSDADSDSTEAPQR